MKTNLLYDFYLSKIKEQQPGCEHGALKIMLKSAKLVQPVTVLINGRQAEKVAQMMFQDLLFQSSAEPTVSNSHGEGEAKPHLLTMPVSL